MRRPISRADALLLARTAAHLQPAQVLHRVRLRTQRAVLPRFPRTGEALLRRKLRSRPGWPAQFRPIEADLAEGAPSAPANASGKFSFLRENRQLGDPPDWEQAGASHLWRYHLHYFEWAWAFGAHPDRAWASTELRALWRSWRSHTALGRGDAWSPYVVSLRAWVLCGLFGPLVVGTSDEHHYLDDLALHASFVRTHLELDVGGNHLVKNLKALIGLGIFLGDDALMAVGKRHLSRQIEVQVLADGGHFERSPSYHCQVLGDLIDVKRLMAAASISLPDGLEPAIAAMRRWLGAMVLPDGEIPLFNDCTFVGLDRLARLGAAPRPPERLSVLQPSGYVVVRPDERTHLVCDVGPPCPPELPAHAHADCLSFELCFDGKRMLVNSGTSTYEPGQRRQHERSTSAHNTVEVDNENQTEVWATFRAARLARAQLEGALDLGDRIEVVASHDGYRRLPGSPLHRRRWVVRPGQMEVLDEVLGLGVHQVTARLHVEPDVAVSSVGEGAYRLGPVTVRLSGGVSSDGEGALTATTFGALRGGHCLSTSASGALPLRFGAVLTWPPSRGLDEGKVAEPERVPTASPLAGRPE